MALFVHIAYETEIIYLWLMICLFIDNPAIVEKSLIKIDSHELIMYFAFQVKLNLYLQ